MAKPLFYALLCGCVFLGLTLGWIVFSEPNKIEPLMADSNWAEWTGAAAAWVIGIAAWRYQSESFRVGMRKELRIARTAYNGILWKTKRAVALEDPLDLFLETPPEQQILGKLHGHLEVLTAMTSQLVWTEHERSYLDDEALDALVRLEHEIFVFVDSSKYIASLIEEMRDKPVSEYWRKEIDSVTTQGLAVARAALEFMPQVEKLRDQETTLLRQGT